MYNIHWNKNEMNSSTSDEIHSACCWYNMCLLFICWLSHSVHSCAAFIFDLSKRLRLLPVLIELYSARERQAPQPRSPSMGSRAEGFLCRIQCKNPHLLRWPCDHRSRQWAILCSLGCFEGLLGRLWFLEIEEISVHEVLVIFSRFSLKLTVRSTEHVAEPWCWLKRIHILTLN